jgi:hypothetical protein
LHTTTNAKELYGDGIIGANNMTSVTRVTVQGEYAELLKKITDGYF